MALIAAACDPLDRQYFREGIGTEIYTPDVAEATRLQDIYLTELCRQSMSVTTSGDMPDCAGQILGPREWTLIVQAGMNDIDRRCDAYLAWLDDRKRTYPVVIKQLGDMSSAAQGLMRLAGVGADPITMVGIAFGLATNTFTNIQSRLLLEVDKTTVQSLVLSRRNDYRIDLNRRRIQIENRPAAVHALRSYLNICTPFTIETSINTAITIYEQGGAKIHEKPMINPETVRSAIITSARDPLPKDWQPPTEEIEKLFRIQVAAALCVPRIGKETEDQIEQSIQLAVKNYLVGLGKVSAKTKPAPITKRNRIQLRPALDLGDCKAKGFRNAFEVGRYGAAPKGQIGRSIAALQRNLRTRLGLSETDLPISAELNKATRDAIVKAREGMGLKSDPPDQVDNEFLVELRKPKQ